MNGEKVASLYYLYGATSLIFPHSNDAEQINIDFRSISLDEITIEFIQKYEKIDYIICRWQMLKEKLGRSLSRLG